MVFLLNGTTPATPPPMHSGQILNFFASLSSDVFSPFISSNTGSFLPALLGTVSLVIACQFFLVIGGFWQWPCWWYRTIKNHLQNTIYFPNENHSILVKNRDVMFNVLQCLDELQIARRVTSNKLKHKTQEKTCTMLEHTIVWSWG